MDEITIEDKKYISSKQATKLTGYAKDYIGQLCREGRVPARLIGRNWYVLETALADHRFGKAKTVFPERAVPSAGPMLSSTWETPRYEASQAEILPPLQRSDDVDISFSTETGPREESKVSRLLQDSWREWFERIANDDAKSVSSSAHREEIIKEEEEKEVSIPVRAIHHSVSAELAPRITTDYALFEETKSGEQAHQNYQEKRKGSAIGLKVFSVGSMLMALLVAILAIISTGYFDRQILGSQVSAIAGIILYDK